MGKPSYPIFPDLFAFADVFLEGPSDESLTTWLLWLMTPLFLLDTFSLKPDVDVTFMEEPVPFSRFDPLRDPNRDPSSGTLFGVSLDPSYPKFEVTVA